MQKKLHCLLVDDEPISRDIIQSYISHLPFLEISCICEDAVDALSFLSENSVDLIFSDIEMPLMNGLDFVKSLSRKPAIIYITAHSEYAIDGFDIGITDFLSKPVEFDRFLLAVNRAVEYIRKTDVSSAADHDQNFSEFTFIKAQGKLLKVNMAEIIFIESNKDHLYIHTADVVHKILMTLKAMESELDPKKFFKIQRSFIINIDRIHSLFGNTVELTNKKVLSISPDRKEELYKILNI